MKYDERNKRKGSITQDLLVFISNWAKKGPKGYGFFNVVLVEADISYFFDKGKKDHHVRGSKKKSIHEGSGQDRWRFLENAHGQRRERKIHVIKIYFI